MELTQLQLEIQQRADKTLSFGCLVSRRETPEEVSKVTRVSELQVSILVRTHTYRDLIKDPKEKEYEIIGHPVSRGRLCFLWTIEQNKNFLMNNARNKMARGFGKNLSMYQKNILERPEEIQKLVMQFLLTLTKK